METRRKAAHAGGRQWPGCSGGVVGGSSSRWMLFPAFCEGDKNFPLEWEGPILCSKCL
ncbi:hypothetical protein PAHAL_5G433900 [Panicum hallii]|uniref:Uncharacterized protein n=1 Tax=Panicum hallii TaxID=206008 RepID=A0A2T8IN46_9POAL|nr:hypothetical protein PAHAL_5G433900 [Panicum hallii]